MSILFNIHVVHCVGEGEAKGFFQFEIIINAFLFLIHLNTYVMGLRPLEIFLFLQCGDLCRRQNLMSTDVRL